MALWNIQKRRAPAPMLAMPQAKLDASRQPVSIAVLRRSNSLAPDGPPAVSPTSTA